MEPQECRRFYIYHNVWLLSFPTTALLPLRYPADLGAVPSAPRHSQCSGAPMHAVGKAQQPKAPICVNDLTSAHAAQLQRAATRWFNEGGLELEINPIYIIVQLQLRSHNCFLGSWIFFWKKCWYEISLFTLYLFRSRVLPQQPQENIKSKIRLFQLSWSCVFFCTVLLTDIC